MTNIFEHSNISDPNIYSDIHSYQNFDTNEYPKKCSDVPLIKWSNVQMFTCSNDQMFKCSDQSVTNIFEYSNIRIFLIRIFIRIFVRIIFWIRIYSDIRLCQLFGYEYIRIFIRSKILIRIYSDLRSYQFSDSDNDIV